MMSEICKKCGECCKGFPFIELSPNEVYELGKLTGLPSDVFANQKGEAVEEYFLKFKKNGNCFFLNESEGDYLCSVYEARSKICRDYPSKPCQHKVCNANREIVLRKKLG